MDIAPIYEGKAIYKLLNQRPPIMMVSTLASVTDNTGVATLTVDADNIFCSNNKLTEPGLIEHIAQSASAVVSYICMKKTGSQEPPVGYIGEVKKLKITPPLPQVGDEIVTTISIISEVGNIYLFSAQASVKGDTVATCQMKLSM